MTYPGYRPDYEQMLEFFGEVKGADNHVLGFRSRRRLKDGEIGLLGNKPGILLDL